jgi:small subunit ribosomal protein S3
LGQKTHPVGFRLQINKNWKSTWFAGESFAKGLEEDVKIRKYLLARLPNGGISKIEISRTSKTVTVTIFTARPGIVIGKGGEEVNRLKNEIRQLTNNSDTKDASKMNVQVNISEIKRPELDAALVGSNIAHQLQKKSFQIANAGSRILSYPTGFTCCPTRFKRMPNRMDMHRRDRNL